MGNLSSTASSSTTHRKKYEVFLSFRGEDTRDGFTSHLFEALRQKQIETFIDNRLIRGDEISPALLRAIGESKIAVVVFSKDYASSKWCLRELAEVMKYNKLNEQIVIPVFYHVDPSDVRKQIGSFKYSFAKHENELQEEVQKWREALTEASSISGWDSSVIRPESTFVSEIVKDIWKKLNNISGSSDFPGLIGIDKHVERVISLLCLGVSDFGIVGIWGMGGIGKTTVADAVFQLISYQFESSYFVSCVRETTETNSGLLRLRDEILSEVLNEENLKVSSPSIPQSIKSRLNHKKVLIVLDDVDKFRKLEVLVGGLDRFGPGSRIILTTRDRQVLLNSDLDDRNIYKIDGLNDDEALQLFCNNAFKQNHPTKDLIEVSKKIVNYANGNPLALKVLGSSLYRKSKREWESAVEKLQRILNPEILDVLKISYDALDDDEKDLFLDIACFQSNHQLDNFPDSLSNREFSLRNLIDKSLVTIQRFHPVEMHGLLREMGREIVRKESPNKPGNRSRLWRKEDVLRTLKNDEGTDALQGIFLTMIEMDVHLSSRVFEKMYNLKTLIIKWYAFIYDDGRDYGKVHLPDGLDYLPDELRCLHWDWYPLEELPSCFNPVNLVELDLANSNIKQLWDGRKCLPKLKWLDLSYCKHLIRIPDLSDIPSAEHIYLGECISLLEIHSSPMDCKNLKTLHLHGCISLTKFPRISGSITRLILTESGVEEVPSEIQSLSKLEWLAMEGCRRLRSFPKILEKMELKYLDLDGTAIKEPPSIENLNRLERLSLRSCENLEMLPSSISNLRYLDSLYLCGCSKLEKLPPLSGLSSLRELDLKNCNLREIPEDIGCLSSLFSLNLGGNGFESLPKSIKELSKLNSLCLNDCSMLQSLTELPSGLSYLDARNCNKLIQLLPYLDEGLCLSSCENLEMLPSSISNLRYLDRLYLRGCSKLEKLPPLSGLSSLTELDLENCNLREIPEDIGCLSSLRTLILSGNCFESLPKSIKELSELRWLSLNDCSMLQSLTELPSGLSCLDARNCNKLIKLLPDESEFELYADGRQYLEMNLMDCLKLDQKAVSNVFRESVLKMQPIMIMTEEVSPPLPYCSVAAQEEEEVSPPLPYCSVAAQEEVEEVQEVQVSIYLSGSEIPEWFRYKNHGSSINIPALGLRHDCGSNRYIMGFAVCMVVEFEENSNKIDFYDGDHPEVSYDIHIETRDGHTEGFFRNLVATESIGSIHGLDHILLGHNSSFKRQEFFQKLICCDYVGVSFEFHIKDFSSKKPFEGIKVKHCGIHPINVQLVDSVAISYRENM